MGNLSVAVFQPENPADILADNPDLVEGSSWSSYFVVTPLFPNAVFSEAVSISGYPATSPYPKPYYIVRPLTGVILPNIGVVTPVVPFLGNSVVSTLSIVEDTTPGSEVIDLVVKTNFMDYTTEGSITDYGLLGSSFTFVNSATSLIEDFPGYLIKETNATNELSGTNVTITYVMMAYDILITRIPGGASTDTLQSVADIIQHADFSMADQATNTSFKFYIKNTDATNDITLQAGTGWTFSDVTISPKKTCAFVASINYNASTAKLVVVASMSSVP